MCMRNIPDDGMPSMHPGTEIGRDASRTVAGGVARRRISVRCRQARPVRYTILRWFCAALCRGGGVTGGDFGGCFRGRRGEGLITPDQIVLVHEMAMQEQQIFP